MRPKQENGVSVGSDVVMVMIWYYPFMKGGQSVTVWSKLDAGNTHVFAPERPEPERADSLR
ncbi:MAG: hypothetical protein ABW208_08555 [Pyrinomonadaceae bacterium]